MDYRHVGIIGVVVLSACGGSKEFTDFSNLSQNGGTELSGDAITASYTTDLETGETKISNLKGPNSSKATTTNVDGIQQSLSIDASGSSVSFDAKNGDYLNPDSVVATYLTKNGQDFAAVIDPTGSGYNYQTFGVWLTGYNTGSGTLGTGSFGNKTSNAPEAQLAVATYTGQSIGFAKDGSVSGVVVSGASLSTTFREFEFSTTGSTLIPLDGAPSYSVSELDLTGKGKFSDSKLSGNVSSSLTSGSISGSLYGPDAEEVGGTFNTSGAGGAVYVGSFGAKR